MRHISSIRATAFLLAVLLTPAARTQETATARKMYDGNMLPGLEVRTFERSDMLFPVNRVRRGSSVRPLLPSSRQLTNVHFESRGTDYDLFDYMADNRVAGLLVLKDGKVAFEDYELGTDANTRWVSFSMAKSVASTLVGAAVKQGRIGSLDDPLVRYLPQLKSGPYADVSIRNIMQMASGVKWDETYTDSHSNRRQLLDIQLAQKPGGILSYMNTLSKAGPPGSVWKYSTGESFVIGAVIEAATQKSLAAYCSEVLWSRLGMEQDASWWLESAGGMGLAGSGMSATLRDYGRFALFVQQDGVIEGERVVPEGWFQEAGSPHIVGGSPVDYGYLWWPVPKGDPVHAGAFQAVGIFGQHMYINPNEKLAIVVLSARPKPDSKLSPVDDLAFFAAVAKSLR